MPQLRRRGYKLSRRSPAGRERPQKAGVSQRNPGAPVMKLFSCQACGQLLYFENIRCENCGRALGYLTDLNEISALEADAGASGWHALAAPQKLVKFCNNYDAGMCNWLVGADDPEGFCLACRHNRTVPDLTVPGNDLLWRKIETAKGNSKLAPDLARRREPLEAYPLEGLSMVGTLERGKGVYALVRTPEKDIYQVRPGNYMGQNFGVVTGITDSEIKLKELVQDGSGDWAERTSTLNLQPDQRAQGSSK